MTVDFSSYRYRNLTPRGELLRRLIWQIVWLILFRPTPRWALHSWRRFLLRCFGAQIGVGSRVAPSCRIWAPWNLTMGAFSVLAEQVDCYTMDKIVIGSKVAISQRCFLCAGTHDIGSLRRPLITAPIRIDDHVWICAESLIMPGIHVGEGTVVGARSLVTRNLPSWMICVGNPCRPVRTRELHNLN